MSDCKFKETDRSGLELMVFLIWLMVLICCPSKDDVRRIIKEELKAHSEAQAAGVTEGDER